jgi:hypothetical protein
VWSKLGLCEGAAAAVSGAGNAPCLAPEGDRRGLRRPIYHTLDFYGGHFMAEVPGGRLCFTSTCTDAFDARDRESTTRMVDANFRLVPFDDDDAHRPGGIKDVGETMAVVASDTAVFYTFDSEERDEMMLVRHDLITRKEKYFSYQEYSDFLPCCVSGDCLFVVSIVEADSDVLCFDAKTLAFRFRLPVRYTQCYLAASETELFVTHTYDDQIQVYSMTGVHLRDIAGGIPGSFTFPDQVAYFEGHLYLMEESGPDADEKHTERRDRILVMTPQGEIIQSCRLPAGRRINTLCIFQRQLVVYLQSAIPRQLDNELLVFHNI